MKQPPPNPNAARFQPARGRRPRRPLRPRQNRQGVALVVTMILLALITTLAIAFLGLTHRETRAVGSMQITTEAELTAEAGAERAKAMILAQLTTRNLFTNGMDVMGPDLMVSVAWDTNWIPQAPNTQNRSILDVSPPVFVDTNRAGTAGPFENRFFLDLNRNGKFEETGNVPMTDVNGNPIAGRTNWVVGDPQWIAVPQNPLWPHSSSNRFLGRYAFLIQPIGRSLDLNWIHNQVGLHGTPVPSLNMKAGTGVNAFFRNQGIGSWEINLAGFLADLNTNAWGSYQYDPLKVSGPETAPAASLAFNDARELLQYRYTPSFRDLLDQNAPSPHADVNTFYDLFTSLATQLSDDGIDRYGDGPLGPLVAFDSIPLGDDNTARPWPGSDSKRHFYTLHDFFDAQKLPERQGNPWNEYPTFGFRHKLQQASALGDTYDRYTYYTMLAQLGTDSAPEDDDKVNINYVNIPSWRDPSYRTAITNWWSWTNATTEFIDGVAGVHPGMGRPGPELFLLTVATNLLVREPDLAFIVTNAPRGIPLRIPIYTNGSTTTANLPIPGPLYCGRVHQILQLAANVLDATTGSKQGELYPYLPSVFRPQFEQMANGDVYITNYVVAETAATIMTNRFWHDLDLKEAGPSVQPNHNVYGIPLIIGARKGYPNFNEFGLITTVEAIRRLEVLRPADGVEAIATNQSLIINITNAVGVEALNSYSSNFPRRIDMYFGIRTRTTVTNNAGVIPGLVVSNWSTGYYTSMVAQAWEGSSSGTAQFRTSPVFYQRVLNWTNISKPDVTTITNWGMTVTNRMLFFLVDFDSGRIVDAVSFNGPRNNFDLGGEVSKPIQGKENIPIGQIWSMERDKSAGVSRGVAMQIRLSAGLVNPGISDDEWRDYENTGSKTDAIQNFRDFLVGTKRAGTNQVPFTQRRHIIQTNYFRVNDPLVHYTMEDLDITQGTATLEPSRYASGTLLLGTRNPNSIPWNNGGGSVAAPGSGALDPTIRDPGVISSDYWDFPTNRFPSVGWLGRVHRGTPWQTIYLKSKPPGGNWVRHSGPSRRAESAKLMIPPRDWDLLDIFTAAHHPNATRGRLSINQTNAAAWSAVMAGVVVSGVTNDAGYGAIRALPEVIQPASVAPPMATVAAGITATRARLPGGQFQRFGQILSVPELTFRSPFLNTPDFSAEAPTGQAQVYDTDYERIPQQILGLIKLGEPRFVIYAWGQSLKPARRNPQDSGPSIVTSGTDRGLVSNYQITGETATRTVVKVNFERFDNGQIDYGRPHLQVESFNVLPNE